jgi:DNA replication protein DnaC
VAHSLPKQPHSEDLCEKCHALLVLEPDWLGGQSYCAVCDTEQAVIDQNRLWQEEKTRKDKNKQAQITRYLADSCIGVRFKGKSFTDYNPVNKAAEQALDVCRSFSASFRANSGTNMIFVGSPGTGKNMLSAVIGQDIIKRGFSFLHTTALKIVRRYKDSWKQPGVTEEQVLRYYTTPDLLVIDEIGVQFGTVTEQLYLTELINDRYEAMKPIIMLSNLTIKQIEDAMGVRSMERFQENGGRVVVFNWPSYRRRAECPTCLE